MIKHTRMDVAEMLMGIVCNASRGDWTKETPEWQQAARAWVDHYYGLDRTVVEVPRVALDEALAALYGARECLGNIANLNHAIELLEAAKPDPLSVAKELEK